MKPTKEKIVATLKDGKIKVWNRWRMVSQSYIDLRGADLDFSSGIPLWCGGQKAIIDNMQARKLVYYAFAQQCDDPEYNELKKIVADFANKFHRVESGEVEKLEVVK